MSSLRWILLGLVPAIAISVLLAQPPAEGKKVALLIGVNAYANRNLDDLKYAERDVIDLAATLKDAGFTVRVLRGGDGITDKTSGQQAYFLALNEVLKGITKEDVVLLAFSGHGQQLFVKDKEVPFFCPRDAVPTDPTTLVSLNDVLKVLDEKGGGWNLLLVDACRNVVDPDKGARGGINGRRIDNLPEGTAVFFACSGRQKARETNQAGGGHGVFFHFVLEGLRGAKGATNEKGQVTWDRLVPFVKEQVEDAFPNWFTGIPKEERQIPFAINSLGDVPPLVAKTAPAEDGTFTSRTTGMRFVRIKAGTFTMGSSRAEQDEVAKKWFKGERQKWMDEETAHEVTLTRDFYLGIHEVTRGQFWKFVEDTGYKTEAETDGKGGWGWDADKKEFKQDPKFTWRTPGLNQTDEHPVVNVTWEDAQRFVEWLSRKDEQKYRLPTEAEWEYSCRGGAPSKYHFGNDDEDLATYGNVADGTALEQFPHWTTIKAKDGYVFTAPVGRFKKNPFGLYDMHGNVWEWCADWYGDYPSGRVTDPTGPQEGSRRVVRGGSWSSSARFCRAADRDGNSPGFRSYDLGFRLARVPPSGR